MFFGIFLSLWLNVGLCRSTAYFFFLSHKSINHVDFIDNVGIIEWLYKLDAWVTHTHTDVILSLNHIIHVEATLMQLEHTNTETQKKNERSILSTVTLKCVWNSDDNISVSDAQTPWSVPYNQSCRKCK